MPTARFTRFLGLMLLAWSLLCLCPHGTWAISSTERATEYPADWTRPMGGGRIGVTEEVVVERGVVFSRPFRREWRSARWWALFSPPRFALMVGLEIVAMPARLGGSCLSLGPFAPRLQ